MARKSKKQPPGAARRVAEAVVQVTPSSAAVSHESVPGPESHLSADFAAACRKSGWHIALACLGLLVMTLAIYVRAGSYGFADLDDPAMISQNPHVKDGFAPGSIAWAFTDTTTFYWEPVTWLSHMLDCQIFGLDAGSHHLASAGLHGLNAVLLFLMLLYLTGALWRSGLVAALFAVHPLRVESVVWLAERRDVLSGLFSIATLWAYAWYAERPNSRKRYGTVLAAFWLALMSKPMAVTVPAVLLLLDYWPLGRWRKESARKLVVEKIPLFVSAAVASAITYAGNSGQAIPFAVLPLHDRVVSAFAAYTAYLGKLIWPARLAAFYPHVPPSAASAVLAGFVVVLLSAVAIANRTRRPWILVGWLWFIVTLLPVIGLVQVGGQFIADRFTYFPLIGPSLALVWLGAEWLAARPRFETAAVAAAAAVLVVLSFLAWRQTGFWADDFTRYRHTIEVTENNERMLYTYATVLARAQRMDEAVQLYREAIRLAPLRADDHEALAAALVQMGRASEAMDEYRKVVELEPENVAALKSLATGSIQSGAYEDALRYLQTASRAAPNDPGIRQMMQVAAALYPPGAVAPQRDEVKDGKSGQQEMSFSPEPELHWLTKDQWVECGTLLGFLAAALLWPEWGRRVFARLEHWLARIARKPAQAMALAAFIPMAARVLLIPVYPLPEPVQADEFGYLLIGDTFASGRLANPPHPMGDHLEALYILQRPSYTSEYPVAQGALLALPLMLGVNPWLGVWLSVGLMCAAMYWMLAGWMPPRWALLGALLASVRLSVLSHWMNSFWGGAVPAIGGALVLGALPRILRGTGDSGGKLARYAATMGVGMAILGQSRPYEGLLLSIPAAAALTVWLARTRKVSWSVRLTKVAAPLGAVLVCFAAFTAYYNWRVSGNPLELPYQLYQKLYGVPQTFYWQAALPPGNSGKLPELEAMYQWQLRHHDMVRSFAGAIHATALKLQTLLEFYVQPVWSVALVALLWLWRNRRMRFLALTGCIVIAGVAQYPFFFPHYLAPACAALLAMVVAGIRSLRMWRWRGRPVGASMACGVVAVSALGLAISPAGADMQTTNLAYTRTPRNRIIRQLEDRGGKHLVIVHYGPNHVFHYSVINNDADIDGSPVVWARDLGPEKNAELIRYFHGRTVWSYDPDKFPIHLLPYGEENSVPKP